MKIIVPYAGEFPTQAIACMSAINPTVVDVETHYVGESDEDYFYLLARLWRAQESFIVVEHDILVTEAAIMEMIECAHEWCSCPYPWYNTTMHGLGCTKFDQQIMQAYPTLFDEIATVSNDIHPAKHWCNIDDRMRRYLTSKGHNDHQHTTAVGHLRPYASHGCVLR